MNNFADALFYFDSVPAARDAWEDAIEFSRSRGLSGPSNGSAGSRLRALLHLGEWDELRVQAEEVLRWAARHGGGQLEVFARLYLSDVLVHRGAIQEAAAHVDALVPLARSSGDPQVVVPGLTAAALVASARGDTAELSTLSPSSKS